MKMNKKDLFALMGKLDDRYIAASAYIAEGGEDMVYERPERRRTAAFFQSGWFVAILCAVVSLSVVSAIVWAGRQEPGVAPPIGATEQESDGVFGDTENITSDIHMEYEYEPVISYIKITATAYTCSGEAYPIIYKVDPTIHTQISVGLKGIGGGMAEYTYYYLIIKLTHPQLQDNAHYMALNGGWPSCVEVDCHKGGPPLGPDYSSSSGLQSSVILPWTSLTPITDSDEYMAKLKEQLGLLNEKLLSATVHTAYDEETHVCSACGRFVDDKKDLPAIDSVQSIKITYCANVDKALTVTDPTVISNILTFISEAGGEMGESTMGHYGTVFGIEIVGKDGKTSYTFNLWDSKRYSIPQYKDADGYEYFFDADMSEMYEYLNEKYPVEFWYPNGTT